MKKGGKWYSRGKGKGSVEGGIVSVGGCGLCVWVFLSQSWGEIC